MPSAKNAEGIVFLFSQNRSGVPYVLSSTPVTIVLISLYFG